MKGIFYNDVWQVASSIKKYWLHLVLLFLQSFYIVQLISCSFLPITYRPFHSRRFPLCPQAPRTLLFCLQVYLYPRIAMTNYHKLGGLKQQRVIVSWYWRLEVWNQGFSRLGTFWRTCWRICSMPLSGLLTVAILLSIIWLVMHHSNLCLLHHSILSLFLSVSKFLFPCKDTSH